MAIKNMKIGVIGSRSYSNRKKIKQTLDPYLDRVKLIVSGGADGADRLGERWANKNRIETLIYYPEHKKYKHAFHVRNRKIVEASDLVIAFWNGRSSGTKYTIDYAKKMGVPVIVVR